MRERKKFVVHTYRIHGGHKERKFKLITYALSYASQEFMKNDTYKVKVWDLNKGPIERNNPNAPALIHTFS